MRIRQEKKLNRAAAAAAAAAANESKWPWREGPPERRGDADDAGNKGRSDVSHGKSH